MTSARTASEPLQGSEVQQRHRLSFTASSTGSSAVGTSYSPATGTTVAVFYALFVLAAHCCLAPLTRRMVARERCWATVTARAEWATGLLAVAALVNAFVLPLGAALRLDNSTWWVVKLAAMSRWSSTPLAQRVVRHAISRCDACAPGQRDCNHVRAA